MIRIVTPRLSLVVPTVGRSPHFDAATEALLADAATLAGGAESIGVVPIDPDRSDPAPSSETTRILERFDRVERAPRPGFAAANNVAWAVARGEYVALVNDDAIVSPGWCAALCAALDARPEAAAAQGVVRRLDDPNRIDGAGLGWNGWWQAVQLGHGQEAETWLAGRSEPWETFGVSATAAVYRRAAVDGVMLGSDRNGTVFDESLFAYYEDVELAIRLRAAGFGALVVPAASALHAGSTSGRTLPFAARPLIHGNRHLVLARALGRAFWTRWPKMLLRDAVDALRLLPRDPAGAFGVVAGVARAITNLGGVAHTGHPRPPLDLWRRREP